MIPQMTPNSQPTPNHNVWSCQYRPQPTQASTVLQTALWQAPLKGDSTLSPPPLPKNSNMRALGPNEKLRRGCSMHFNGPEIRT